MHARGWLQFQGSHSRRPACTDHKGKAPQAAMQSSTAYKLSSCSNCFDAYTHTHVLVAGTHSALLCRVVLRSSRRAVCTPRRRGRGPSRSRIPGCPARGAAAGGAGVPPQGDPAAQERQGARRSTAGERLALTYQVLLHIKSCLGVRPHNALMQLGISKALHRSLRGLSCKGDQAHG